jgi:hypothetical protein
MFRALHAHPQEALNSSTWYTVCMLCQLAALVLRQLATLDGYAHNTDTASLASKVPTTL